MKLTPLGKDFVVAMVLTTLLGLTSGQFLFSALGASMGVSALVSLGVLGFVSSKRLTLRPSTTQVRVFKGEEARVEVELVAPRSWVTGTVESIIFDSGEADLTRKVGEEYSLVLRPLWAGRSKGLTAMVRINDALGLFAFPRHRVELGIVVDSLPNSLRTRQRILVAPTVFGGERPGGSAGKGQEYYSVEEYTPQAEARDIMWKRAAREPGHPLLARVRELNVPSGVAIAVERGEVEAKERMRLVDLQSEALGALGSALLAAGIRPRYVGTSDGIEIFDDWDLAEATMEASDEGSETDLAKATLGDLVFLLKVGKWEKPDVESNDPRVRVLMVGDRGDGVRELGVETEDDIPAVIGRLLN